MRARQSATTASAVASRAATRRAISVAESSLRRRAMAFSVLQGASRRGAGDLAEDSAGDEAGAARIVEVEDPAHQFAGRIEPADRLIIGVEHLRIGIDPQA